MKVYRTFDEIDRDLKILHLKTKIEKEELKLNIAEIKDDFSIVPLATNFIGGIAKKAVMLKAFGSMIGMVKKRK